MIFSKKSQFIFLLNILLVQTCIAFYAFTNYNTFDSLNSFYDQKFYKNKKKQIKKLKKFIKNWDKDSNLILVTHYVVILELLGVSSGSGEIIVSNKDYELIDRIQID